MYEFLVSDRLTNSVIIPRYFSLSLNRRLAASTVLHADSFSPPPAVAPGPEVSEVRLVSADCTLVECL
jgi:hypothetical protein